MSDDPADLFDLNPEITFAEKKLRSDCLIVAELTRVLTSHPGGLRRWSVMRAIRKDREHAGQDIPQNFEAEVERIFRRFCTTLDIVGRGIRAPKDALFFRPAEKAGEVWAMIPPNLPWLETEIAQAN
jgi:hypothetical protein